MLLPPTQLDTDVGDKDGEPIPTNEELLKAIGKVYNTIDACKAAEEEAAPSFPGLISSSGDVLVHTGVLSKLKKISGKLKAPSNLEKEWLDARIKPLARFLRSCGAHQNTAPESPRSPPTKKRPKSPRPRDSSRPGSPSSPHGPGSPRGSPRVQDPRAASPSATPSRRGRLKADIEDKPTGETWKQEALSNGRTLASIGDAVDLRQRMRELRKLGPKRYSVLDKLSSADETPSTDAAFASPGPKTLSPRSALQITTGDSSNNTDTVDAAMTPSNSGPSQPEEKSPLQIIQNRLQSPSQSPSTASTTGGPKDCSKQALADINKALDWLLFPGLIDENLLGKHRKDALKRAQTKMLFQRSFPGLSPSGKSPGSIAH